MQGAEEVPSSRHRSRDRSLPAIGSGGAIDALALLVVPIFIGATAYFGFRSERAGERSFWLFAAAPVVGLTPFAIWRGWRRRELGEWLRPKAGDFTLGFLSAGFLFGAAYAFSKWVTPNGSSRAIWLARLYLQLGDPNVLRAHPTALFAGLIVVAAAEEIVWRGLVASLVSDLLAGAGRRRFGFAATESPASGRWGWAISAVLYALAYVPAMWSLAVPTGPNPVLPIAAIAAGLVWGAMARRFGRLTPGIVSHALFDWSVVVIFRLWGESL